MDGGTVEGIWGQGTASGLQGENLVSYTRISGYFIVIQPWHAPAQKLSMAPCGQQKESQTPGPTLKASPELSSPCCPPAHHCQGLTMLLSLAVAASPISCAGSLASPAAVAVRSIPAGCCYLLSESSWRLALFFGTQYHLF